MNPGQKRLEFPAEQGIFVGAIGFVLGSFPFSRFQPTLFLQYRLIAEMLPLLAAFSLLAGVVCLVVAIRWKRPLKAAVVFSCLCFGLVRLFTGGDQAEDAWQDRFVKIRAPMETAIRETRERHEIEIDQDQHPLTSKDPLLAYDHRICTYRDEQNRTWFMFLQYMSGIDNGFGYAWSANDEAPPEQAYSQIVRTKRLGDGWYMFWTT